MSARKIGGLCQIMLPCTAPMSSEAALAQHKSKLMALDHFFAVDLAFLEHMAGASGAAELQRLWFEDVMPDEGRKVTLEESVRRAKAFLSRPLFLYAGGIAQGTIRAGVEMLTLMEQGKAPVVEPNADAFLKKMFLKLPFFVRIAGSASGSASSAGPVRDVVGKDALMKLWDDVIKNDDLGSVDWQKLQPFIVFGFLLEKPVRDEIMTKLDGVVKNRAKARKRASTTSTATAAAAKKSKTKGDGEEEAKKLVSAIFGGAM